MRWGAVAPRGKIDLAGISLGVGNKLGNRLGRKRWIHHHDGGLAANARDGCDVADEIEIELVVERGVERSRWGDNKERVTIGPCTHDRFGADVGTGSRPVLDEEWPTKALRQPLDHEPRNDIRCARWS